MHQVMFARRSIVLFIVARQALEVTNQYRKQFLVAIYISLRNIRR